MIINIRGTGGSGKSTLVREVMARYDRVEPSYVKDRKRPICYRCYAGTRPVLYVPGHYETPCGGGDTLPTPESVFTSVKLAAVLDDHNALFEGIITQDDVNRTAGLAKEVDVKVIALDTPIDVCLDSIRSRRAFRGDTRELNPKNTVNRHRVLRRTMERLKIAGVDTVWATREDALAMVLTLLGFSPDAPRKNPMADPFEAKKKPQTVSLLDGLE